ncbi:TIM barrel protein [Rhabdothermincola salaria]|uniref:TIM barrel protein n=1 Tax=Rhabdothermincola salaria TaxID=2903142 RepID=UPI001E548547|nr:TIM barrel protein [Rhabdothermincola salaria]MCD9622409.1 TIM barrel protein [Rhabdothermincola salaria]
MAIRIETASIAEAEAGLRDHHDADLDHASEVVARSGASAHDVVAALRGFSVAAPSWALGTGSTRFGRFPIPGEPRTVEEKVDDVAALHALTGANASISLHVPWDRPAEPVALREHAASLGLRFDAMNSNTFQDNPSTTREGAITYKYGSMSASSESVRAAAVEHNLEVIALGDALGSTGLTVWLGDGTNHPGQADFRTQFDRVATCLRQVHDALPEEWTLYTEHKPFEPAFYSSVNADWGSSLLLAQAAGSRARCLVDLGHHLPNCNVEQVVSRLAMTGRLGGFHFNDSKYGDDDLTVGSIQPYQLFLIMLELLLHGGGSLPDLAYMIDESHNVKDPIEDLIQATDQIQVSLAQALLVDRGALTEAQDADDPVAAAEILQRAYRTDVRPLVAEARRLGGAAMDPIRTFRRLGYRRAVAQERGFNRVATGL